MPNEITIGLNRTGMQASPHEAGELLETLEMGPEPMQAVPSYSDRDDPRIQAAADLRLDYAQAADPVGSVPPPMSLKGVVGSAKEMLQGNRMHILLDKLGERAAFERSGTRLYDAFLQKLDALDEAMPEGMTLSEVERHRNEEASNYNLLVEAIESLGGDPTTQTPCADVAGVQGMGLMQAMTDPRTTLPQALQTLLSAELIDEASWELLIELAEGFDQPELVQRFTLALEHEQRHADHVRMWLSAALSQSALGRA